MHTECYSNNIDPDQKPRSAASDLGLHCFLRAYFPNAVRILRINKVFKRIVIDEDILWLSIGNGHILSFNP